MTATAGAASYDELAAVTQPRVVTELPGPRARAAVEADERVTSPSLPRAYAFVPARGAGAVLEDVDGNVFLDFNAGIAVCSTGHAHPAVVEAMTAQAQRLLHYSASDFYLPVYTAVCERLDELAPMSAPTRSFLCNSGTEGVEAAIKLARHHTRRQYVVGFLGSFHGRSYGSVSLTASSAKYHAGFGPMLPGVVHAPYAERTTSWVGLTDDDARTSYLEDVVFTRLAPPDEVAAVVVEPVLGEGGYVVPPAAWLRRLRALRELCDEHGILYVDDEVQAGMGRTGPVWAIEHYDGVEPDVLVSGKSLGGGLPLAAITARAEIMDAPEKGGLGGTFGGNPL
ncbi:MAG TPA: aminotransferase class III-fold pyridoxal phosphate-dependent enzyme [Actinomycetota bacterium]|nr:aminotransferase class III-fold pyridoxal phosphate-dependent enzyme [Actinomycetota bacterium]